VAAQAADPDNFKDLVENLLTSESDPQLLNFYLATALATAVIRLASNERIASS
jgi:hypothetical protein